MLSRAFEWYRIVNAQPTSQTIDNRKAAASDVVTSIDEAKNSELALGCAAAVVAGFDTNFTQESTVVQTLVGAIRTHESAFPQDLSENALDLRATASLAIGEILVRSGGVAPSTTALLVASVLRSGLGTRPSPKGRHLKQLLGEIDGAAATALDSSALSRRRHLATLAKRFDKLQDPADLPAAWKSLVPELKAAVKEIAQESAIDREELNVLWWMFAGASTTVGKPLAEMPDGAAVLCCGAELGNQCMVPPTLSLEAMVRRAYAAGRKPQGMTDRSIEKVAADWDADSPRILVPDEKVRGLAQSYPSLFPLSWLCQRLLASKGPTGWAGEFERMTGIPSAHARPPADWAIQVFRERVAYRVYAESLTG